MADVLGDVSLDTGYAEALIILGDRTIKGVGGGVCQVSTTLFHAAFFGGYQIDLRWPHAYRVKYYEQTASGGHDEDLAGLDTTVFAPQVDFRFTNNSPNWLLMETYPGNHSLTWKFYSTSDGRTVDWQTSGQQNIVEPPDPSYEENPDLAKDEIKQVDWAVDGADVSVTRNVTRDGSIIHNDTFETHYIAWQAKFSMDPERKSPHPSPPRTHNKLVFSSRAVYAPRLHLSLLPEVNPVIGAVKKVILWKISQRSWRGESP